MVGRPVVLRQCCHRLLFLFRRGSRFDRRDYPGCLSLRGDRRLQRWWLCRPRYCLLGCSSPPRPLFPIFPTSFAPFYSASCLLLPACVLNHRSTCYRSTCRHRSTCPAFVHYYRGWRQPSIFLLRAPGCRFRGHRRR